MARPLNTLIRTQSAARLNAAITPAYPETKIQAINRQDLIPKTPTPLVTIIAVLTLQCHIISVGFEWTINPDTDYWSDILISTDNYTDADALFRDQRVSSARGAAQGFRPSEWAIYYDVDIPITHRPTYLKHYIQGQTSFDPAANSITANVMILID